MSVEQAQVELAKAFDFKAKGQPGKAIESLRLAYRLWPGVADLFKDAFQTLCLEPLFVPPPTSGFQMFALSDLSDPTGSSAARRFFDDYGYLVVNDALKGDEVAKAYGEFQRFMALGGVDLTKGPPSADRTNSGIVASGGTGHSSMNWYVRSCKGVQDTFRFVHQMQPEGKLITSFDGFNVQWNPETSDHYASTVPPWFHVDAGQRTDHEIVQGLVNLVDCTDPMDAGLVLLPRSQHTVFPHIIPEEVIGKPNEITRVGMIEQDIIHRLNIQEKSFRVPLPAGALAVWRSSVLHCNTGCGKRSSPNPSQTVRRLAVYVCMTPDPQNPEITRRRIDTFRRGQTTGHHPERCRYTGPLAAFEFIQQGVVIVDESNLPPGAEELL
eukprot:PhF_6_TR37126/c0_g1_i5/m.54589